MALSTAEAEYIAANEEGKETVWLRNFFQELGLKQGKYVVYCDSQSAMDLSKNATYHACTKHVDMRYHLIREVIEKNLMKLEKIHTNKNPSDMMTKVVSKEKQELCLELARLNFK
ncbi:hypothetical protein AAC387_Pa12g0708 [Persea americana]